MSRSLFVKIEHKGTKLNEKFFFHDFNKVKIAELACNPSKFAIYFLFRLLNFLRIPDRHS